jgi:nucleotide-binding universal stress UspA family protein
MQPFRHILFPVDFSDRCRAIQPMVEAMARKFDSRVTIMHVPQIPTAWYGGMEVAYPAVFDLPAIEEEARQQLRRVYDFAQPGESLNVKEVVKHGDPATSITDYAENNGVDLVMMPTHGVGKMRRFLLGSVTAKVLHDAKCPVWTVGSADNVVLHARQQLATILCAVDTTPESLDIIRWGSWLASEFQAKLRLVYAAPSGSSDSAAKVNEFFRVLAQPAGEAITDVHIGKGSVTQVVCTAALEHKADLIVAGRGRMHETFGRLRTNSYAIIRDAPCPVLSV